MACSEKFLGRWRSCCQSRPSRNGYFLCLTRDKWNELSLGGRTLTREVCACLQGLLADLDAYVISYDRPGTQNPKPQTGQVHKTLWQHLYDFLKYKAFFSFFLYFFFPFFSSSSCQSWSHKYPGTQNTVNASLWVADVQGCEMLRSWGSFTWMSICFAWLLKISLDTHVQALPLRSRIPSKCNSLDIVSDSKVYEHSNLKPT